ncbi:MAG: NAD-dependent epimerase/dehydratase family protein [Calditrichaceae bacterium]|nr:NAD-dependent epimerase/dehydratase family protein [Calditrichaceae bacterium]MBN2709141.1 NAD-dependent epimerase/dehydratase family protein [Calditrichaceae bacterium]RQV96097.1 MAG: NAD-dependent epimerase/dehydratase family protein [Calditrichota bacterium]
MKFLITGINGFIGSHVAERLLKEGHTVRGLVRKTSDLSFLEGMTIDYYYGDITQPDTLSAALKNVDTVIHVAGLASDWGSYKTFHKINVQGTINLAKEADIQKVKRFVHISTTAFYGFGRNHAVKESDDYKPTIFPYSETKREAEKWLFEYSKKTSMKITAIRPGNVFGPRDHTFMEKYLEAMEQGKMAYIDGGASKTCPSYIENVLDGILLACFSGKADGEAFFITDGLDIDWKTFTDAFADELGIKRPKLSFPFYPVYFLAWVMELIYKILGIKTAPLLTRYRISNGGRDYYLSIEKAKRILGYTPKVDFNEAVKRTVQWYKNRG